MYRSLGAEWEDGKKLESTPLGPSKLDNSHKVQEQSLSSVTFYPGTGSYAGLHQTREPSEIQHRNASLYTNSIHPEGRPIISTSFSNP